MPQPHPDVQAMIDAMGEDPALNPTLSIPELRAACDAGVNRWHHLVRSVDLHEVRDVDAGGVPARLYLPTANPAGLHVHLHGGGWWMGSVATTDPMARELAAATGLAVLSVDYRLAPEHAFPAAPDDVYTALLWAAEQFPDLTLSIGGESAGGNLAAVVALMARDRGGPTLVAQWLDVPAVDITVPPTESVAAFSTGYGLEIAQLAMLTEWYAPGLDLRDPYISPAYGDLQGLPPALVTTAELDPLRDQGELYAEALRTAGNEVFVDRLAGHLHATCWFTALNAETAARYDAVVPLLVARHQVLEVAQ